MATKPAESGADETNKVEGGQLEVQQLQKDLDAKAQELATREAALAEREKALAAKEEQERATEAEEFAEGLVKAGKVLPRHKAPLAKMLGQLAKAGVLEFSEDGGKSTTKQPTSAWLRKFLEELPKQVEFGEVAPGDQAQVNHDPVELAERAQRYQADQAKVGRTVSSVDAVRHVKKGGQ